METLTEVNGQLEDAVIRHQNDDVAGRIEHRRADLTMRKVLLYIGADRRVERALNVGGDVVPNMSAVQNDGNLLLSIPPFLLLFSAVRN